MPKPIAAIRKPEIVQATMKAISRHGLPMLSYDLIAQEVDMSRQLIRHYFPDPETLMVAVCDALAANYRELLLKGILDANSRFLFQLPQGQGAGKARRRRDL
jgi:AcrR family transcriptional regulator